MGLVIWLIERKLKPDEFGGHPLRGIAHGIFWAFESLVGKAGSLSRTRGARVVALLWTFTTMLLVSGVTAKLSAELTVNQLSTSISGPNDLPRVKVGCVKGTGASRYLDSRSISFVPYPNATAVVEALAKGEVDAVVDEAPILKYQSNKTQPGKVVVLPGTFVNHGYGFGLPVGSPLLRRVNLSLLKILEGAEWNAILTRYLGSAKD